MDSDSDVEENAGENSEYESEGLGWKSNLRGAPVVAHWTQVEVASEEQAWGRRRAARYGNLKRAIYENRGQVIDISSE